MTTVADLIEQCYDHLYGGDRQVLTLLDGAITDTATTVTLTEIEDVAPGAFLSIDDEMLYVRTVVSASRQATVLRAQRGTTAATHADDAVVEVNPKFPRHRVRRALLEEIRSWPKDVFRVDEVDIDTASGQSGYDMAGLAADFYDVLDLQLGPRPGYDDVATVRVGHYVVRGADAVTYPSGVGLVLTGLLPTGPRDLRVVVSRGFTTSTFTDATDAEATVGLAATMLDIPPMGAAARLMLGREVKRTFGEGQQEPRRAEEVPVGSSSGTATFLRREVSRRLAEEATRLRAAWPVRKF